MDKTTKRAAIAHWMLRKWIRVISNCNWRIRNGYLFGGLWTTGSHRRYHYILRYFVFCGDSDDEWWFKKFDVEGLKYDWWKKNNRLLQPFWVDRYGTRMISIFTPSVRNDSFSNKKHRRNFSWYTLLSSPFTESAVFVPGFYPKYLNRDSQLSLKKMSISWIGCWLWSDLVSPIDSPHNNYKRISTSRGILVCKAIWKFIAFFVNWRTARSLTKIGSKFNIGPKSAKTFGNIGHDNLEIYIDFFVFFFSQRNATLGATSIIGDYGPTKTSRLYVCIVHINTDFDKCLVHSSNRFPPI